MEIKDQAPSDRAAPGSAIAAMPVGALLPGLLAPALIQWLGAANVASLGLIALALAVTGVPLPGPWVVFAALMLVVAALDAVVDVAQNRHGFRMQRAYGRSIVNTFTVDGASARSSEGSSRPPRRGCAPLAAQLAPAARPHPRHPAALLNNQPVRHDDQDLGEAGRPRSSPLPGGALAVPKPRPVHEVRR
jgi:hypothetical protein